jgi:lipopolysaccharide/colanic/teichoic acid biosynthesis glycosyltransferase/nucleoside-diphosphate-sugar epimerase
MDINQNKKLSLHKSAVLVTGATGFIGQAVAHTFLAHGKSVIAASRCSPSPALLRHPSLKWQPICSINQKTEWLPALQVVHTVVHCAARVHVMRDDAADRLTAFRETNLSGTLRLAQQSAVAGVERFIFISSIGVNGCVSSKPLTELSPLLPHNEYSLSKLEAEQALLEFASRSSIEVVIIRPPLVYGKGAPGNFGSLVHWVQRGLPIPLDEVDNKRSLVAIDNLVSLIVLCADRTRTPQAANQVFVVADCEDVSTPTLLRKIAKAAGRSTRILRVPTWLMRGGARLLGRPSLVDSLLSDLQVDPAKARTLLGWRPVCTMDEQLAAMFSVRVSDHFRGQPMLRLLDFLLAGLGLLALWPLLLLVFFLAWFDTQSPLFIQRRVGRHQKPFSLIKFRTMQPDTAHVASHLVSKTSITRFGAFLRKTKLDELPQLLNVLLGQMSLVGPRPGLYNQKELMRARQMLGIYAVRPGITGLAQVRGVDMSTPDLLARMDKKMLRNLSVASYLSYILMTIAGKGSGDRVKE